MLDSFREHTYGRDFTFPCYYSEGGMVFLGVLVKPALSDGTKTGTENY